MSVETWEAQKVNKCQFLNPDWDLASIKNKLVAPLALVTDVGVVFHCLVLNSVQGM